MSVSVSLLLDESNLQPFSEALRSATGVLRDDRDRLDVARQAERCLALVDVAHAPEFVRSRLSLIPAMSALLRDQRWQAPVTASQEIAGALAYFTDQCDLIPDASPQFGLLDDALIIELALRHNLAEWRQWLRFDAARQAQRDIAMVLTREDWLSMSERQRAQLSQRPSWKRFSRRVEDGRFLVH